MGVMTGTSPGGKILECTVVVRVVIVRVRPLVVVPTRMVLVSAPMSLGPMAVCSPLIRGILVGHVRAAVKIAAVRHTTGFVVVRVVPS